MSNHDKAQQIADDIFIDVLGRTGGKSPNQFNQMDDADILKLSLTARRCAQLHISTVAHQLPNEPVKLTPVEEAMAELVKKPAQ